MNDNSGTLIVKGLMYNRGQREEALAHKPAFLVESYGNIWHWLVSLQLEEIAKADPMLAKIIAAHLAGKWVMIMDPNAEVRPDSVAVLTEQQRRILQRHMDVLRKLPFEWGEQKRIRQELGITHKQMQFSLQYLKAQGYARDVRKGRWEPTFLEGDDAET